MNTISLQPHLCPPSDKKVLVTPTALVEKLGNYLSALVLNQLHYWTPRCGKDFHTVSEAVVNAENWIPEDPEETEESKKGQKFYELKWIYNSIKEWKKQFPGFTTWQIRKAFEHLREKKLVYFAQFGKSGVHGKDGFDRRGYYAINYEKVQELLEIPETLVQPDLCFENNRIESHHKSSYITENNSSENNTKNNISDDVASAETLSREFKNQEQEKELPQNSRVVEKPKLKSREKQTNPHEDKDYAAAQRDTTSPDTEMNKNLVEGLGVELNPKLKRFLASVTVEELLKGLAGYFHNREYKETKIESITGYLIDSTQNTYIQSLAAWVKADEATRRFVLLTAGALAMGIDLYGGYIGTMQSGKMGFTRHDGMVVPFNFQALQQMVLDKGYTETLKAMWRTYQSAR